MNTAPLSDIPCLARAVDRRRTLAFALLTLDEPVAHVARQEHE